MHVVRKAEFSFAIAVMDKIGGWEDCYLQRTKPHAELQAAQRSMMKSVNWVCDDAISCQYAILAIRPGKSVRSPVEYVMVLGTNKAQY